MTDIFDKVVKGIETGVDVVGSKTKELWDLTKIRAKISDLNVERRKLIEELGEIAYEMLSKNAFNFERLNAKAAVIVRIEEQISKAEEELKRVREEKAGEATTEESAAAPEADEIPEEKAGEEIEDMVEEELEEEACVDPPKCECGAPIVRGARYCISCGRPVSSGCKCK